MSEAWYVDETVARALRAGQGVVALESAFLTHGLPRPVNLQTARAMLEAVAAAGSVPAMLAVWRGRICVGVDERALTELAEAPEVVKASRRDLAIVVERRQTAGLTVAASVYVATQLGIRVLATGGLGGVRRRLDQRWDISADLWEIARQPVAVVCSGAKSLMDAAATWEWLEMLGVPVLGWNTKDWPGFLLPSSGLPVQAYTQEVEELARWLVNHWRHGGSGAIVAIAPPKSLELAEHERALRQAELEAVAQAISGPNWTPFILQRLAELTQGRSLEANRALLIHNAQQSALLAQALVKLNSATSLAGSQ